MSHSSRSAAASLAPWLLAALCPAPAAHALTPDQVVVLYNSRSPNSLRVAKHYLAARNIPLTHLIGIASDPGEGVAEEQYRTSIVPQLKKALVDRKLDASVRCLVTTYDMPLKIAARQPSPAERQEITLFQNQLDAGLKELARQIAFYDAIAPAPQAVPAATLPAPLSIPALSPRLNAAANAAANRFGQLPEPARAAALRQFMAVHERVAGVHGLASILQISPTAPLDDPARKTLNDLSGKARLLEEQYLPLAATIAKPESRKQIVAVRSQSNGLIGMVRALEENLGYLRSESTESCFDNELALALVDEPYALANWLPNVMSVEQYNTLQRLPAAAALAKTLIVCRIDGSSVAKVEEMIDTTLAVEQKGLDGKLYLDARGNMGTDAYALFDADLRRTAAWMHEHASIEVFLDDKPDLLQASNAPSAALYCGWYSLHHYQDSGQWLPGAVGYHVASFEMPSLHTPGETGWVVNLLDRGFCGSLGATDEPYLTAFPKPSLFFPLLLSGAFSQGEVWALTAPMTSWRVGYVGDPLYTPFKAKPRVKISTLAADPVLKNAFKIMPRPPAQTLPSP